MQNEIRKTETNQLPCKVAADQKSQLESIISEPANFVSAKIRVVRTKLFHDNGQHSQMIWHMPDYTPFMDFHHEAVDTMNEFIAYIATKWVGVHKYHTEFGVLDAQGKFKPCPAPYHAASETIIPKGAKFLPGTKGKWIISNDLSRDLTAADGCHCATDGDFCGDGCINTKRGGASC